METLEPRLLLSTTWVYPEPAEWELPPELLGDAPTAVIERTAETEFLFDADDLESVGVIVMRGTPIGEDGVWWNWSGSISIPDGPSGTWVGLNCLAPGTVPRGTGVTRVAVHHEIVHSWIGDLEVKVYNGVHTWMVRDNEGGSAYNINETRTEYSLFDGDDPVQDWYYRVRDTQALDTGTLTVMQLFIYYEVMPNTPPQISGIPDVTLEEDGSFPTPPAGLPAETHAAYEALGFDGDTSDYLGFDRESGPTGDATPTGESYLLYEHFGGTWHDTEKTPSNTEDDLMCWAAAASNVLTWTGWGLTGGMINTDQIFAYFQNHWTDEGGLMEFGWDWWFDGTNNSQGWSGWSQVDVAGGGFYPTELFSGYFHEQSNDSLALEAVDQFLRQGYGVTLGLYGPGGHAISCWGVNYNPLNTSDYYGVWVTDSDDYKYTDTPPDMLRYYQVQYASGRWYLQDYYGSNDWYIGVVQALDRKPGGGGPGPSPDEIDLWAYASDAQSPDSALIFTIVGNTNPNCGVSIVDNRYVHINPAANWFGTSTVTIRVSDGSLSDTDSFVVTVTPVNDAPVITGLPDRTLRQDTSLNYTIDLWTCSADVETADPGLSYQIVGNTSVNCGVRLVAGHYISIIPTAGWTGTSEVTVQVSDGELTATDTFVVTVEPACVDLTGSFGTVSLVASPLPGASGYAYLRVTNIGNTTASGYLDLQLWATSDGDLTTGGPAGGVGDYLLTTLTNRYIYLPPGQTATHVASFRLPQAMTTADYRLCLVVDSDNDFTESNENNNQVLSTQQYAVREPFVDLTGTFGLVTIPTPTWAADVRLVQLQVTNNGNVTASGTMNLQLWASGDGNLLSGTDDYLLAQATRQYVYLPAGSTGSYYMYARIPDNLPSGTYHLVAVVDAANNIAETNPGGESNNQVTLPGRVVMAAPDLTLAIDRVSLPAAAKPGSFGYAYLRVTNQGSVRVYDQVDIQLWATNDGDISGGQGNGDYLLTTLTSRWVILQPGASATHVASFVLPAGMSAGDYRFLAVVDSSNDVVESNETNNQTIRTQQFSVSGQPTGLRDVITTGALGLAGDLGLLDACPEPVERVSQSVGLTRTTGVDVQATTKRASRVAEDAPGTVYASTQGRADSQGVVPVKWAGSPETTLVTSTLTAVTDSVVSATPAGVGAAEYPWTAWALGTRKDTTFVLLDSLLKDFAAFPETKI